MFTHDQLVKGMEFLERHGFFPLFVTFKIPERWHQSREVECIDLFSMVRYQGNRLSYGETSNTNEEEECDLLYDLLDITGPHTCSSAAKYIYELLVYSQTANEQCL